MPVLERRQREKEARRQQILDAARDLFFDRGFEGTTIDEIAQRTEISKGAVYLHFPSKEEIYFTLPRPGGDAWVRIDRSNGEVTHESTWRGWIAFANDLHKGRNTGPYWGWFIDLFASACIVFCLTGFGLLWLKATARRFTWPLLGVGVVIPLLLALFFLH